MKPSVVIFAREPAAGRVKTRLAAGVGEAVAARVYEILLERTLRVAAASPCDPVVSLADRATTSCTDGLGLGWEIQRGADLGGRMRDAFSRRFAEGYERVVVVGSDCPGLRARHFRGALAALESAPVVLGPATDGGYWLVAQRRPGLDIFSGIPWSSRSTLEATRRRLETLGAAWRELEELSDVDTYEDLQKTLGDPAVDSEVRRKLEEALAANPLER